MGSDVASAEQESEHRLLLELAKETFAKQIAKHVRPLSRGFMEHWMRGELWLYPDVIQHHATHLRAYKPVVLEVLRATSVEEMLDIRRRIRPDLTYLWHDPAAEARLTKEIDDAIKAAQTLFPIPPTQYGFRGGGHPKPVAPETATIPPKLSISAFLRPFLGLFRKETAFIVAILTAGLALIIYAASLEGTVAGSCRPVETSIGLGAAPDTVVEACHRTRPP